MSSQLSLGVINRAGITQQTNGGASFPSSLIHEYDGSNTSTNTSTTWYDEIGSDNITLSNTTYDTSTNGGIYVFNGSNSYGLGSNIKVPTTGGFSVMAWVRTDTNLSGNYFASEYGSTVNSRVWILGRVLSGSDYVLRSTIYGEGTFNNNVDTYVLNLNTWYYIGFVYDPVSNTLTNYANGASKATITANINTVGISSPGLRIGSFKTSSSTSYYPQDIGYIGIYDSPITSSEVLDTYNLTKTRFI